MDFIPKLEIKRRWSAQELNQELPALQKRLGYQFQDPQLLLQAFAHSSYLNEDLTKGEGPDTLHASNERLEFLGDAVLSQIIALELFLNEAGEEGRLSSLRADLVDTKQCCQYCYILGLHRYILIGRGCLNFSQKSLMHLFADLFEAYLGAMFLDAGFERTRTFFLDHFASIIAERSRCPSINWKSQLQNQCQKRYHETPNYAIEEEEGPEHARLFTASVWVGGKRLGTAQGRSKQDAQVAAAREALHTHFAFGQKTFQAQ